MPLLLPILLYFVWGKILLRFIPRGILQPFYFFMRLGLFVAWEVPGGHDLVVVVLSNLYDQGG